MRSLSRLLAVAACLTLGWALIPRAGSQQPGQAGPTARLYHVFPGGGQLGTSFEVIVSGTDVADATGLWFSTPGITAESVGPTAPPMIDPKAKQPKGPLATSHKFRVTVAPSARLGNHDVRVITPLGITNPRVFVVGDLQEFSEQEPNNDTDQMQRVQLNCTVHGTISSPVDVDYYSFAGSKGQRVVLSCLTSSIDSKLPATIELFGPGGALLGVNRNYKHDDALLDAVLPADGDYYVRVASFAYTLGGPDYFYRLTISTAPWIDAVYPPVVEPGTKATVTVYGRNLPGGKADPAAVIDGRTLEKITTTVDVPKDAAAAQRLDFPGYIPPLASGLDGFEFRLRNDTGSSNGMLLTFAQAPVVLSKDDHGEPVKAQPLTLPCEVAGKVMKKGDRDWYKFGAKKGEVYSIDIYADRLGAPVDMYFQLRTPDGKLLKEDDDNPEILSPQLYTPNTDPPRYRFVAPADGTYELLVANRFNYLQAGPRHQYRLRITPETPDFRVVAMPMASLTPDAPVVRQGGHQVLSVYVWRQDGFAGNLTLTGEDLPPGVTVRPQVIPSTQKQAFVVVSAAPDAKPWEGALKLVATATVHGKQLVREVRGATMTWPNQQVNIPAVSRLDRGVVLAVRERGPFSLAATVDKIVITQGDKLEIPLKLERYAKDFATPVQVVPINLPQGIQVQPVTLSPGKDEATVPLPANQFPPGTYTVVFRGTAGAGGMKAPKGQPAGISLPSSPVTVTVVPKAVATVQIGAQVNVKPGGKVEVPVTVNRLVNFEGEFKVEVLVPADVKGLSAAEATIAAGANNTTLTLVAAADAPGGAKTVTVRVTASFDGVPLHQEKKLTVNVK
jgi:hypothetical protein